MRRHIVTSLALVTLAVATAACSAPASRQPRATPTAEPLADGFDRMAALLGLTADQRAKLARGVVADPTGDFFHPDPKTEVRGERHADVVAAAAFTLAGHDPAVFEASGELACDEHDTHVVWCTEDQEAPGPGGIAVFCVQMAGPVPTAPRDEAVTTSGVALVEQGAETFGGTPGFKDYWEGASRTAGLEIFDEPATFSASYSRSFGYFEPNDIAVRVVGTDDAEAPSTLCTIIPRPDAITGFRMFSFTGSEQGGGADVAPREGFSGAVAL